MVCFLTSEEYTWPFRKLQSFPGCPQSPLYIGHPLKVQDFMLYLTPGRVFSSWGFFHFLFSISTSYSWRSPSLTMSFTSQYLLLSSVFYIWGNPLHLQFASFEEFLILNGAATIHRCIIFGSLFMWNVEDLANRPTRPAAMLGLCSWNITNSRILRQNSGHRSSKWCPPTSSHPQGLSTEASTNIICKFDHLIMNLSPHSKWFI